MTISWETRLNVHVHTSPLKDNNIFNVFFCILNATVKAISISVKNTRNNAESCFYPVAFKQ